MRCCCENGKIDHLKMEGDEGADPFWCKKCGCNLDIEDIPISGELTKELTLWIAAYGNWIDWENDKLRIDAIELEKRFNQTGVRLMECVKKELGSSYTIEFIPSTTVVMYS
ncbi:MAG: hypothetical protein ACQEWU_09830 [Bacillota bacterium]|uniref:Uncharacterized protein n=1 Tax=Virgibacillus salarius TaxID=447199 RepID=A0A941DSM6_9BACI|nr:MULTISPECIES: hypothetical protein [Bacillaceae]NAZ07487.1 hypothetical protein [Agaribacter marinus]MBR7794767.1 hypothetical protein [Virgibacillus salarius]MCC2249837.1 hypothetical protein [Virgibacillus sp. AGTR]MDY7046061.1 hypothetical protein [Virgibacillus sp. M23]QRZ19297.1 hypothetical protein JUJ52_06325 [Virgibacillus sp. AGTR]